ncbi:MAG: tetratricopeptide repeat protein [Flavobacteriales bacterium]|jgi:Ca-activated chloride channel family protein|tara:strand:- start:654 stop:1370 length:717 start_codon:yes stop_codon:yes gene_type:complete
MVLRIFLFALLALQCVPSFSQSSKLNAALGSDLYKDSLYDESIHLYNESLKLEPNNEYLFNLGNAYLKSGDLENAQKTYSQLLNSSSASEQQKSKAAYNLGNLNYAEQNLGDAIKNYKEALRLNPEDIQASENLQIALAQLQQQQEKQKQQKQQQEQQDQNQDEQGGDEDPAAQPKEASNQEKNEEEKKSSQSEHIDLDKADEIMDYLDQVEKKTRERLNNNKDKKGNETDKKPEKDW